MDRNKAKEFLDPGNIDPDSENPYYPFNTAKYEKSSDKKINLSSDEWMGICETCRSKCTVVDNPYEKSKFRDGLAIWDTAIGLPALRCRGNSVYTMKNVPGTRNVNTEWTENTLPSLNRVGRISEGGDFIRPSGNHIFDLMSSEYGWKMLECAHMLAHKAGDVVEASKSKSPYVYGSLNKLLVTYLFKLSVCMEYGMPIDIDMSDDDKDTNDMFDRYGIIPSVSTQLRAPSLSIECATSNMLIPDKSVCVLVGGVHIEPHPYSVTMNKDKWLEINKWSCAPTIVVDAGWELVDVISHMPLASSNPMNGKLPICYSMPTVSLNGMNLFDKFLECAKSERGECKADNIRYWNVIDYLDSEKFYSDLMASPVWPCNKCIRMNMKSEGSPMRPRSDRPDKKLTKETALSESEKEWLEWDEKMEKIIGCVEKATVFYEGRILGSTKAKKIRKTRMKNYRKKIKLLKRLDVLCGKIEKKIKDGRITEATILQEEQEDIKHEIEENLHSS